MSRTKKLSCFLLPSISDLLFLVLFLCLTFSVGLGLLNDTDTGYHIRAGDYILNTHKIPHYDIFSHISPPLPWTAHEWLSEVIMAFIHRSLGLTGIVIFFAFLLSITYFLFFRMIRADKGNILLAIFIAIFVVASSTIHWHARPHIFSILLTLVWYYILDAFQNGRKNYLVLLPLVMVLWVNLHGGFITGFILLGAYFTGNLARYRFPGEREQACCRLKSLAVTAVLSLLACLLNPFGYHILTFPFNLVGNRYLMDNVSEFLSPNFHEHPSFRYLLLILITFTGMSIKKLSAIELLLILLFTNMALYSARYIPLFAIIAGPILVRQGGPLIDKMGGRLKKSLDKRAERLASVDVASRGHLWPVAGVVAVIIMAAHGTIDCKFNPGLRPVAAVEFLKNEHIKGNMFNNDQFGSYIIYEAWPKYRVFFDGRSDMYGVPRVKEYLSILNFQPGWENIIEKYQIGWIICKADSRLCRYLLARTDWKPIYADKVANIFVRNNSDYQFLINKYKNVRPVQPDKTASTSKVLFIRGARRV